MKFLLASVIVLAACQSAFAQCCCDHCGCQSNCKKICRVVCEVKKVPKITYDCECEEFCVPGKSCRTTVCDECGNRKHVYTPTCGEVRTRTKLVKKETFEEKVTYRWVVETLCCGCAQHCAQTEQTALPAPTQVAERISTLPDASTNQPVGFQSTPLPAAEVAEPATSEEEDLSRFDPRRLLRRFQGQ